MRALLTAISCEPRDLAANLAMHVDLLRSASESDCDLAVFPEFSLTGSIDPQRHPEDAIEIDGQAVATLAEAAGDTGVAAVFGLSERCGEQFFITQAVAASGQLIGSQRKRHLGDDELAYSTGSDSFVFELQSHRFGIVICAEAHVDWTWDATIRAGADTVLCCSAPGLYGRRLDEASWRDGFEWWNARGLGDARRHARRLRVPVAMATQAGATVDEDFPGIAALVSDDGEVVDRLPDWRPGAITVDLP